LRSQPWRRLEDQAGHPFSDHCYGQSRGGAREVREHRSVSDAKAAHLPLRVYDRALRGSGPIRQVPAGCQL